MLSALLAVILAGCASKPTVSVERRAATGIESGEAIAVVLGAHEDCRSRFGDGCPEPSATGSAESALERCLSQGLRAGAPALALVSAPEFWSNAFPGTSAGDRPRGAGTLMQSLGDGRLHQKTEALNLRYVVTVLASTTATPARTTMSSSRDGFAIGREWKRTTSVEASILDLKRRTHSGTLGASSTGAAGYGGGVVVAFIPIPFPIFFSAMTESTACNALGEAVARFILGSDPGAR